VPAMTERYRTPIENGEGKAHRLEARGPRHPAYPIANLVKAHHRLLNIAAGQAVPNELVATFRYNDAILRHLVIPRDTPETEQSLIMQNKDEKGDKPERSERRRRDDEEAQSTSTSTSTDGEGAKAQQAEPSPAA